MSRHRPPKRSALPRLIYGPRIFGWFIFFWILLSALDRPLSTPIVAWMVFTTLLWPQVAFFLSSRSILSPTTLHAVHRNQWLDCLFYGIWVVLVHFDPWVTMLLVSASTMNTLGVGGFRQFAKGSLALGLGVGVTGGLFGWSFRPDTDWVTMALAGGTMVAYAALFSYVAYRQALSNAKHRRRIKAASLTDALTGVGNRRFLEQALDDDVRDIQEAGEPFALTGPNRGDLRLGFLIADLDHFKAVNDRYGHDAGDRVLKQVAQVFLETVRSGDTVIRWGGEEFLIVARGIDRKGLQVLSEKLRRAVADRAFELGDGVVHHQTCSIGFAPFPFGGMGVEKVSWERVIGIADDGLYAAKQAGRNAWVGIVPPDSATAMAGRQPWLQTNWVATQPDWVVRSVGG